MFFQQVRSTLHTRAEPKIQTVPPPYAEILAPRTAHQEVGRIHRSNTLAVYIPCCLRPGRKDTHTHTQTTPQVYYYKFCLIPKTKTRYLHHHILPCFSYRYIDRKNRHACMHARACELRVVVVVKIGPLQKQDFQLPRAANSHTHIHKEKKMMRTKKRKQTPAAKNTRDFTATSFFCVSSN